MTSCVTSVHAMHEVELQNSLYMSGHIMYEGKVTRRLQKPDALILFFFPARDSLEQQKAAHFRYTTFLRYFTMADLSSRIRDALNPENSNNVLCFSFNSGTFARKKAP